MANKGMTKKHVASAIPLYLAAAVWPIVGLVAPRMLLRLPTLLVTVALSVGAYLAGGLVFRGKDIEVREAAASGNRDIDAQIEEGRARIDALKAINARLPDPTITKQLDRIAEASEAIFGVLEKDPSKASIVRRFMNYYLPTAEKLMQGYEELAGMPGRGENITRGMKSVESSLGLIADAFDKQLDSLCRDRSFDMETDVQVLETILKSEGLAAGKGTDLHFPTLTLDAETTQTIEEKQPPKAQAGV